MALHRQGYLIHIILSCRSERRRWTLFTHGRNLLRATSALYSTYDI